MECPPKGGYLVVQRKGTESLRMAKKIKKSGGESAKPPAKKTAPKKSAPKKAAAPKKKAPPKSVAKEPAGAGRPAAVNVEERSRMIAEAAYLRAEKRGFAGDPVEDWLLAEEEVDRRLGQR